VDSTTTLVDKNSNLLDLLLKKVDFVRERFNNVVEVNLFEKNQTTVTMEAESAIVINEKTSLEFKIQ
jgi:hypothetical protein